MLTTCASSAVFHCWQQWPVLLLSELCHRFWIININYRNLIIIFFYFFDNIRIKTTFDNSVSASNILMLSTTISFVFNACMLNISMYLTQNCDSSRISVYVIVIVLFFSSMYVSQLTWKLNSRTRYNTWIIHQMQWYIIIIRVPICVFIL